MGTGVGNTPAPLCAHRLTILPLQSRTRLPGTVFSVAGVWQVLREPFETDADKAIPALRQDTAGSQNLSASLVRTPAVSEDRVRSFSLGLRPLQRCRLARDGGNGYGQGKGGCSPGPGPASRLTIAVLRISMLPSCPGVHPRCPCAESTAPLKERLLSLPPAQCVRPAGLPTCQDGRFRGERHGELPDDVRRAVVDEEAEVADGRMEHQRDGRGEGAQHLVAGSL